MLFLRSAMLLGTAEESLIPDFVAVTADVFLTPPSYGHLPYILLCKTQRRRIEKWSFSLCCFVASRKAAGHGRGGG